MMIPVRGRHSEEKENLNNIRYLVVEAAGIEPASVGG